MQPTTILPLREWRIRRHWRQVDLAAAANVGVDAVARTEQGKVHPYAGTCRLLADALGIAPQQVAEFTRARSGAIREPVPQRQWLR